MWLQILKLLNPLGIIEGVLEDRKNKREVKSAIKQKQLENIKAGRIAEAEWNLQGAKNAAGSWKDEWLLVLFSIPLIGSFLPPMVPHITKGFEVLATMPAWYQGAFAVAVAASYGYQKYAKTQFNRAYTLPSEKNGTLS